MERATSFWVERGRWGRLVDKERKSVRRPGRRMSTWWKRGSSAAAPRPHSGGPLEHLHNVIDQRQAHFIAVIWVDYARCSRFGEKAAQGGGRATQRLIRSRGFVAGPRAPLTGIMNAWEWNLPQLPGALRLIFIRTSGASTRGARTAKQLSFTHHPDPAQFCWRDCAVPHAVPPLRSAEWRGSMQR